MRHSTTTSARSHASRVLAMSAAAVIAAGAMSAAGAASVNAATTDHITSATLAWGFDSYNATSSPFANFARAGVTGTAAADDSASTLGFTVSGGTGSVTAAGAGTITFPGGVQYKYLHDTAAVTYDLSAFQLDLAGSRGSLSAVIHGIADYVEPAADNTRIILANFDVASLSTANGALSLQTAAPDYTTTAYANGSWPTTVLDAIPAGAEAFWSSSSASASQQSKKPLPLSVQGTFIPKTVYAVTAAASKTGTFGSKRILTATTDAAATGLITFQIDGTAVGSATPVAGVATVTTSVLAVGKHSLVASLAETTTAQAATSAAVSLSVTKLSTKATVSAKKFTSNTKPKITVKVAKLTTGKYATGKVAIYVKGKRVKTVTLSTSAKGKLTVTLPKRYSSTISVKAKYLGSATVASATSKNITIARK